MSGDPDRKEAVNHWCALKQAGLTSRNSSELNHRCAQKQGIGKKNDKKKKLRNK